MKPLSLQRRSSVAFACLLACAASAFAQAAKTANVPADPLAAAVQSAITTNPDVTARYNAYRASIDAVDVARAGYLPRVDLSATAGPERDRFDNRDPASQTLNRREAGLTVTQLLWDGLGTQQDVARLGHERLTRYFEFVDATEQTALDAAKAHVDVQRYRKLVQLAEDNYVQHRYAFLQIESRVKAGVGRGVDLEQAAARVALAQSNLVTEVSNLHDVTARYQRVVGTAPPKDIPFIGMLNAGLPASAGDAMTTAVKQSAAVSASIESLRGARSLAEGRRSAFQPKVEARLRGVAGRNVEGLQDQTRNAAAEIVLSWNLYNGGADQARVRQQTNLLNQAGDLRDKTCRDTRQTAAIAFNDTRKLVDQLAYLDRNTLAIQKARDAYRQQFDIGQRSLLDLLNAENELYTARRSYVNAEYDLALAYARTHAALNQLGTQLGVARIDAAANDAAGWEQGDDAPMRCPIVVAEIPAIDQAELDKRANALAAQSPALPVQTPQSRKP
ncbi:MAG TPA: TolC family outer membrane protein [Burkholderiaceae bacterium]